MLLKSADDKSKRLALLEDLQRSDRIDARQRKWLREELSRMRRGIEGERESAYFLDQHFKGAKNHVWLHDLRIVFDEDVPDRPSGDQRCLWHVPVAGDNHLDRLTTTILAG